MCVGGGVLEMCAQAEMVGRLGVDQAPDPRSSTSGLVFALLVRLNLFRCPFSSVFRLYRLILEVPRDGEDVLQFAYASDLCTDLLYKRKYFKIT